MKNTTDISKNDERLAFEPVLPPVMKEVTKEELWDFVKDKDVVYSVQGNYPFTGFWKTRIGNIVGKIVPIGKHLGISTDKHKYYIRQS